MQHNESDSTSQIKIIVLMSPDEVSAIDDVRFTRRFPSRAKCIRDLIAKGIEAVNAEHPAPASQAG